MKTKRNITSSDKTSGNIFNNYFANITNSKYECNIIRNTSMINLKSEISNFADNNTIFSFERNYSKDVIRREIWVQIALQLSGDR